MTFQRTGQTSAVRTAPPPAPPAWLAGRRWTELGLRQPGWLILPLRGFLAVTFMYAGLQKLANPAYLDPHNPASVVGQMHSLQATSPIGPLLALSAHAPTLVGLLIAFGELAVGVGALLGLFTRLAAIGGMLLSLTFLLTVSWNTTPYYYGSDIVFLFAWTILVGFGAGGVLSVDGWLTERARLSTGVGGLPAVVGVEVPRLRQLCAHGSSCGLRPSGECGRRADCPVFPVREPLSPAARDEIDRRTLLGRARVAALVAVVAGAGGGLTAAAGRLAGGTTSTQRRALPTSRRATPQPSATSSATTSRPTAPAAPPPGTAVGPVSAVPVGQARSFTDPASGQPAWVVHASSDRFVAFSAVCTHAGCTVDFDPSSEEFVCPCHGGTYDAKTGQVLGGPPPAPLDGIPVHVVSGEIRVD